VPPTPLPDPSGRDPLRPRSGAVALSGTTGMGLAYRYVRPVVMRMLHAAITGQSSVPAAGGVLLAANHRSFLDHFLLAGACPRPMRFLGKQELSTGVAGRINMVMGMVPVSRGTGDLDALDLVAALLRAGQVVGIFPEGTRSPTGELFRFRSGMARIAASARCPIVPVGMIGTCQVWPRVARPRLRPVPPGVLHVRFGEVVGPPDPNPRSRRQVTARVHEQVAALCEQPLTRGFAPVARPGAEPR